MNSIEENIIICLVHAVMSDLDTVSWVPKHADVKNNFTLPSLDFMFLYISD